MSFNKQRQEALAEIEQILLAIEPDSTLGTTVLEAAKTLYDLKSRYHNPRKHPILSYFRKDGMIIYINHNPQNSPLHVNGKEAVHLNTGYNIRSAQGKKQLEEILRQHKSNGKKKGNDGAVEISPEGVIRSYRRRFRVIPDQVALDYGITTDPEGASSEQWGFNEPVFERHSCTIAASTLDPYMYGLTLSEETGKVRLFRAGKILHSPLREEIHPLYKQHLTMRMNAANTLGKRGYDVHKARRPVICAG